MRIRATKQECTLCGYVGFSVMSRQTKPLCLDCENRTSKIERVIEQSGVLPQSDNNGI